MILKVEIFENMDVVPHVETVSQLACGFVNVFMDKPGNLMRFVVPANRYVFLY